MRYRPTWTSRFLVGAGLCLLALLVARGVMAGPQAPDDGCLNDPVCHGHYNQAMKLFEAGRFETALPQFQSAYERRQMPWLLINIGRTLHRLGRPREALDYYERYKRAETKPDPETQERLEKYIVQSKALSDPTVGTLAPATTPQTTTDQTATIPPSTPDQTATTPPSTPAPDEGTKPTPVYKKWWFWTAIGGGVAAVVIIGVAAGVASRSSGLPGDVQTVMFTF